MHAPRLYGDYTRDRRGLLLGLDEFQLAVVLLCLGPPLLALNLKAWLALFVSLLAGVLVVLLVIVPARGRTTVQWLWALVCFEVARIMGWSSFVSRAASGRPGPMNEPDLPGVLTGIRTHDGAPRGENFDRVAIIADSARRTWAATASLTHPGIGMTEPGERDQLGNGLTTLLEAAARSRRVSTIAITIRSGQPNPAERKAHRLKRATKMAPVVTQQIVADLDEALQEAATGPEAFVTVVQNHDLVAKQVKENGGGLTGHTRVLYSTMDELSPHLTGGLGATSVRWLTTPQLAEAMRIGFAPGERRLLAASHLAAAQDSRTQAGVPMALAGPSAAEPEYRCWVHDAWKSYAVTVLLPDQGAVMGALAPITTPSISGEARAMTVFFPVDDPERARRTTRRRTFRAQAGRRLRRQLDMDVDAQEAKAEGTQDRVADKLAWGAALTHPVAVAAVTVPSSWSITEAASRLDASVRLAGFLPLALDMAHDTGFAAAAIPLGVGLPEKRRGLGGQR